MASSQNNNNDKIAHPAEAGVTIYYWSCSLVLLAPSLLLDRPASPLCATLRIACNKPYTIEVEGKTLQTRASLVAPRAGRKRVTAVNSDIALFYIPIDMPEYAALKKKLGKQKIIDLPFEDVAAFVPTIRKAMVETLSPEAIKGLLNDVVRAITGETGEVSVPLDNRIVRAREILDNTPLNEVRLESLAEQVHLSPSRLRELFKKQTGFTIGQYARWRAVWRASLLWQRGLKFTDLALEAGFHDLAHVDRAFTEIFGMNPSKVIDAAFVRLVNCETDDDTPREHTAS
ncbi:helix-turn-helix domain-containing protein [Spongiibacter tropicus]|uniref:helix-turn-helix domain-containing protein n=1 Tax=Spongiibacter tropicus TaxID=454602 RepID=UPI0003B36AE1|nr:AraC family transcriptional regulator [Spongiibacter tropicus]